MSKNKSKILVTGGAGYIGSHIVKDLLENGYQVLVLDNLENGFRKAVLGGDFIKADLRQKEKLEKIFREHSISAVIHFAAYASVPDSVINPGKYFENNLIGGLNLLEAMRKNKVKKIVFSSSAAVYGEPKRVPIKEDDEKIPTSPYGLSKLQFEQILNAYDLAYGIKSVSLRYFCAAGADPDGEIGENHDPETHIIPLAILTALGKRKKFKIFGNDYKSPDGTGVRDFIHVADLANAHLLSLRYLQKGSESKVFNCGNEKGYSVKEVVDKVKKISGQNFKVEVAPRRAGDPAKLIADSTRLKKELGFKTQYSDLETIVKTAYEWYKSHPKGVI